MTTTAVQFQAVSKHYPHFTLDDVSFTVATGTISGFLGANGAGKSTALRILMGLVHQDSGTVTVLDQNLPAAAVTAKRDIGYVSEDMQLYNRGTLQWHMDFVAGLYPTWVTTYATHLGRLFELNTAQRIKGMSQGQRVKAKLLLALARRPKLLVLDEPTTGLDPVARRDLLACLTEAMQDEERTVVFSTQNTLDIEQVADQVTIIDRGRIIDTDDKESYLDRWRRIHLELSPDALVPVLPNTVEQSVSGRVATITTDHYTPEMTSMCEAAGAGVTGIDRMTLEEIFVATITARRTEVPA